MLSMPSGFDGPSLTSLADRVVHLRLISMLQSPIVRNLNPITPELSTTGM